MSQRADRILELSEILSQGWKTIQELGSIGEASETYGVPSDAAIKIQAKLQEMNQAYIERVGLMNEIRETIKVM